MCVDVDRAIADARYYLRKLARDIRPRDDVCPFPAVQKKNANNVI